ncbi:MAG TPA: CHRD domain-containing protein [Blastocatellia bacterium]|nr:CHRD domain-containing protein [Blastocatellia bacterium]
MKRTVGYTALLLSLLLLTFSVSASAETLTASVLLTAGGEVNPNPAPPPTATGAFQITVNVVRDSAGAVATGSTINFLGIANFPGGANITVNGLHIHEGAINANGPVVFNTGLSGTNTLTLTGGVGLINLNSTSVDLAALGRMLAKPSGWYVNLHTSTNPGGAIRAQMIRLVETAANTVAMNTAQEVSPPTPLPNNASGTGTITVNPVRNPATGEISGGTVTFTVSFDLPADSTVVGLHIHEQVAGSNGPVVIDTGLSGNNRLPSPTGKGTFNQEVVITANNLAVFRRLMANPTGFYVNLHTLANTAGVIRGQLTAVTAPPIIQQLTSYFVETGSTDTQVRLVISSTDITAIPTSSILINGQQVTAPYDFATGSYNVTIPAALRANAGTLVVQARTPGGLMSAPAQIVVAPTANVNSVAFTGVSAARYGQTVAPDGIVAGFATRLASTGVPATTTPLPFSLDGSSIFVNGVPARLFFVSGLQANFLLPLSIPAGPAAVNVVARDGTVTRGTLNVALSSPSLFTANQTGIGAPAAVASTDGTNFNLLLGNPDGTPRAIPPGSFVMLFGTGMNFGSTALTNAVRIGTTDITPMFVGAMGMAGLTQCNLQIPASLAAGDYDLIFTMDGIASNTVRVRIGPPPPPEWEPESDNP